MLVSVVCNVLQWNTAVNDRSVRLTRNLLRDSTEDGNRIRDVMLCVLPMSQQADHPAGLDATELLTLLNGDSPPRVIDVREIEEFQTGRIAGAINIRYPDLKSDPSQLKVGAHSPVLACFSGNRSSELVNHFVARGIDCRFLIGGYGKWIEEGRALEGYTGSGGIRALVPFPNRDTLLDTPDVYDALCDGRTRFIDVRYEMEFASGSLPDAINIPLRKLTTPEVDARLAALDRESRYIVGGYDRRSSFYGRILGSKLSALGIEYVGLYTVPHEFRSAEAAAVAAPSVGITDRITAGSPSRCGGCTSESETGVSRSFC